MHGMNNKKCFVLLGLSAPVHLVVLDKVGQNVWLVLRTFCTRHDHVIYGQQPSQGIGSVVKSESLL
jgi:hypothetical protein